MSEYDPRRDAFDSFNVAIAANRAKLLADRCPAAKRVEVIGQCELYLGDCMEILPALGKVDAVVTDPPYEIAAAGGGMGAKRKYLADIDGKIDAGFDLALLSAFDNWFVFCGKPQLVKLISQAEGQGLRWQIVTWNKTNPTPLTNGNYLPDTEYVIHAFKTHVWAAKSRFIVGPVEKNDFAHPTVKPQYVMAQSLRRCSSGGQSVLDPFMGTASTGVACVKSGRSFVGIEISEAYFDIACKRIRDAYRQGDMFATPAPAAPKAEQIGLDLGSGDQ